MRENGFKIVRFGMNRFANKMPCIAIKAHKITNPFMRIVVANNIKIPPKIAIVTPFLRGDSPNNFAKTISAINPNNKNGVSLKILCATNEIIVGFIAKNSAAKMA